jgi:hypothetical protein
MKRAPLPSNTLLNPFLLYLTVSRFISSFDHFTDGRIPWTSDLLVARPLHKHRTTQTQNKHKYETSMPFVGFEPTIPASEQAKTRLP